MSKRRLSAASSSVSQNGEPSTLNSSSTMAAISIVDLPPLPKISGDLMLQTFTHKSLHFEGSFIPEVETNERLAELGDKVLQLVATNVLYQKTPPLTAGAMPVERDKLLSDNNLTMWTQYYHLYDKFRVDASARAAVESPQEIRALFTAYVGAVFTQSGVDVVTKWIRALMNPASVTANGDSAVHESDERPAKRIKEEPAESNVPATPAPSTSTPTPAPALLPALVSTQHYAQPPAAPSNPAAMTSMNYLPLFNQICTQRRLQVDWQSEFQGPPHAGRWNVRCFVNGIVKGHGQASSKQLGKEEAARQAYHILGFALAS